MQERLHTLFPGVKCKQTKGCCKQNALCNTYRYHRWLFSILYTKYASQYLPNLQLVHCYIVKSLYQIPSSSNSKALLIRNSEFASGPVLFIYSVFLVVAVSSEMNTYSTSYFTGHWTHRGKCLLCYPEDLIK